jgi:hypothetical protein
MEKNKIFNLFKTFIGGESIEIEGLYLIPERFLKDDRTIEFSIQNPNNISYYLGIVGEYLNDILFDFEKFTNYNLKYHIDTNYPELYFSKELKNKIQSYLDTKKRLKLVGSGGIEATIYGDSLGFSTETDYDQIYIWNDFNPNTGFVYDLRLKEVITEDLNESVDRYLRIIEMDSAYLESDEVYQGLDIILEEYPLISCDWIALVYHTGFINLP